MRTTAHLQGIDRKQAGEELVRKLEDYAAMVEDP
jgi:hypothetical protein